MPKASRFFVALIFASFSPAAFALQDTGAPSIVIPGVGPEKSDLEEAPESSDTSGANNEDRERVRFRRSVNLILDCSGSMLFRDAGTDQAPKTRGEVCRDVLEKAIEDLDDRIGVGLTLFGHRSFWTKASDGGFEVRLTEFGKQQNLSVDEIDPSFDVKQEVPVGALNENQRQALSEVLDDIDLHTGAQSPVYQAVKVGVDELASLPVVVAKRDLVLLTDGFNRLANADASAKDVTLDELRELLAENGSEADSPVKLHIILFGPSTEDPLMKDQRELLSKLASETEGSFEMAGDETELIAKIASALSGKEGPQTGTVSGKITKNGKPLTSGTKFKVELDGSELDPIETADGTFTFKDVPMKKSFTLRVKGVLRNRIYTVAKEEVKATATLDADSSIEIEL